MYWLRSQCGGRTKQSQEQRSKYGRENCIDGVVWAGCNISPRRAAERHCGLSRVNARRAACDAHVGSPTPGEVGGLWETEGRGRNSRTANGRCTATTSTTLIQAFVTDGQSSTGSRHAPSLQKVSLQVNLYTISHTRTHACPHAQTHMHAFLYVFHAKCKHAKGKHGAQHALHATFVCAHAHIETYRDM